jgi:hypothetical protein
VLNKSKAEEGADQGIAMAERGMDEQWGLLCLVSIRNVAEEMGLFTVDDVWERFVRDHGSFATNGTRDKRAIGPMLRHAAKVGWLERGEPVRSIRSDNHGKYVLQWWYNASCR